MGKDKTITEYEGETFLARAVRFWRKVPQVETLYLSIGSEEHLQAVRKDPRTAAMLDENRVIPVTDRYPGCGPMAGIHAAFRAGDEEWLYVSAIDMPNLSAEALPEAGEDQADAYVYEWENKREPLFALYSRTVLSMAETLLQSGQFKLQRLLDSVNTRYLPAPEEYREIFFNCNTPEDLARRK